MKNLKPILAKNLVRLRTLRGVSQRGMVKIAGVSQKTISNLEAANHDVSPRLVTLEAVGNYFGLHPAILLLDGISDDTLTDSQVGEMVEAFAGLPPERKRQIIDLIKDFSQLSS